MSCQHGGGASGDSDLRNGSSVPDQENNGVVAKVAKPYIPGIGSCNCVFLVTLYQVRHQP
jgi:hypothetical protein